MLETYRDVTAESRVQRKYHALLAREREAKEDLERKVLERTEALRRAQDQLVLNEKMSSLGRLVAGIAHELNNPINFVYGNVDFLGAVLPPPDQPDRDATKAATLPDERARRASRSCKEQHRLRVPAWRTGSGCSRACAPAPSARRRSSPA